MKPEEIVFSLPDAARIFCMNLSALKAYLSLHKEKFVPRQYRIKSGKAGRYRVLSRSDMWTLGNRRLKMDDILALASGTLPSGGKSGAKAWRMAVLKAINDPKKRTRLETPAEAPQKPQTATETGTVLHAEAEQQLPPWGVVAFNESKALSESVSAHIVVTDPNTSDAISLQLHEGKHHFETRGRAVIELCQFLQAALQKAGVTL